MLPTPIPRVKAALLDRARRDTFALIYLSFLASSAPDVYGSPLPTTTAASYTSSLYLSFLPSRFAPHRKVSFQPDQLHIERTLVLVFYLPVSRSLYIRRFDQTKDSKILNEFRALKISPSCCSTNRSRGTQKNIKQSTTTTNLIFLFSTPCI